MQYLLLIGASPDTSYTPSDADAEPPTEWVEEMDANGVRIVGNRLRPSSDASTVRVRRGELLVTDGPYVEGAEYIGGFDVIECENLDAAIEVAGKHPHARDGLIEIRPVWPIDG